MFSLWLLCRSFTRGPTCFVLCWRIVGTGQIFLIPWQASRCATFYKRFLLFLNFWEDLAQLVFVYRLPGARHSKQRSVQRSRRFANDAQVQNPGRRYGVDVRGCCTLFQQLLCWHFRTLDSALSFFILIGFVCKHDQAERFLLPDYICCAFLVGFKCLSCVYILRRTICFGKLFQFSCFVSGKRTLLDYIGWKYAGCNTSLQRGL